MAHRLPSRLLEPGSVMRGCTVLAIESLSPSERLCPICHYAYGENYPYNEDSEVPVRLTCGHIFGHYCLKLRAENAGPWRNRCSHCWAVWYNSTDNGKRMYPEGDDNLRIAQLDDLEHSTKRLEDEVGRWAEDLRNNNQGNFDQATIDQMREHIRVMEMHMRHERGFGEAGEREDNSDHPEVLDSSSGSSTTDSSTTNTSTDSSGSMYYSARETWIYEKRPPISRDSSLETVIHAPLVVNTSKQSSGSNTREFPLSGGSRVRASPESSRSTILGNRDAQASLNSTAATSVTPDNKALTASCTTKDPPQPVPKLTSSAPTTSQMSTSASASTPATVIDANRSAARSSAMTPLTASGVNVQSTFPSHNVQQHSTLQATSALSTTKNRTAPCCSFTDHAWPGYTAPLVLFLVLLLFLLFLEFLLTPLLEHVQCELLDGSFRMFGRVFDWCIVL